MKKLYIFLILISVTTSSWAYGDRDQDNSYGATSRTVQRDTAIANEQRKQSDITQRLDQQKQEIEQIKRDQDRKDNEQMLKAEQMRIDQDRKDHEQRNREFEKDVQKSRGQL